MITDNEYDSRLHYTLTERGRSEIKWLEGLELNPDVEPTKELQEKILKWHFDARQPLTRHSMMQAMLAALSRVFGVEQSLRERALRIRDLWVDAKLPDPPKVREIEAIYKS